jgi:hypothetical protein
MVSAAAVIIMSKDAAAAVQAIFLLCGRHSSLT